MKPIDNIKKSIKKLYVPASTRLDEKIHREISDAAAETENKKSAQLQPNVWRIIMKSKTAKFTAVAGIVLFFSLLSISILRNSQHTKISIDTSPCYILLDVQNNHSNPKEIIPCNILPVLPNQS